MRGVSLQWFVSVWLLCLTDASGFLPSLRNPSTECNVQTDLQALPPEFLLGVSSAAYQIEGAWNVSGKGESLWDHVCHENPEYILDRSNGDVACDSYNQYKTDVKLIRDLGMNAYRISLSWPRILPDGTLNEINQEGIDYYNSLINEIISNGLKPVVTIFHWDLPWRFQQLGGWSNPLINDYFEDYARLVISLFGDRVKFWITVNEPFQLCEFGYSVAKEAPFYNQTGVGGYLCTHNLLLGHARVYRMYKKMFADQKGLMGITINCEWYQPYDPLNPRDVLATERAKEFTCGWSAHPIFGPHGDYPPVMRRRVDSNSFDEGLRRSRLPTFTPEQRKLIKGSADFFGLNHYFTELVHDGLSDMSVASPSRDRDANYYATQIQSAEGDTEFKDTFWGFRKILNYIKNHYGNPPVLITENGFAETSANLQDDARIRYHRNYMQAMLKAIYSDGCNVFGYLLWSLLDDFEWSTGYTLKFGLYQVDFNDPKRTRIPKKSSQWFKNVTSQWRLPN